MKITDEKLDRMLRREENPAFDRTFEFKGKKEKVNNYNKRPLLIAICRRNRVRSTARNERPKKRKRRIPI